MTGGHHAVRRRWGVTALALVLMAAVAGCADLPTPSGVHVRQLSQGGNEPLTLHTVPGTPRAGAPPEEIVRGFLQSASDAEGDYAAAREFLAPNTVWDTSGPITVYDPDLRYARVGADRVEVVGVERAVIDRGDYRLTPHGRLRRLFGLVRTQRQWRLSAVPQGVLLAADDLADTLRQESISYYSTVSGALVADTVLFDVDSAALPSTLVRALLRGPSPWLAPVVTSYAPPGTEPRLSTVQNDDQVTVDLTGPVRTLSLPALNKLLVQIAATLGRLPSVDRVQLLVDGRLPAGLPVEVDTASVAQADDPDVLGPAPLAAAIVSGHLETVSGGPDRVPSAHSGVAPGPVVAAPALDASGSQVAALRHVGAAAAGLSQVVRGPLRGPLRPVGAVGRWTAPTWVRTRGVMFTGSVRPPPRRSGRPAAVRGHVGVWLAGDTGLLPVAAPGLAALGPVSELVASRDGARVLAVAGPAGHQVIYLGRVSPAGASVALSGWRQIAPSLLDVHSVTWRDAVTVVAVGTASAALTGGTPSTNRLWQLTVDGSSDPQPVAAAGPPVGTLGGLAAAPGQPLLLAVGHDIYRYDALAWRLVAAAAADPTYPS